MTLLLDRMAVPLLRSVEAALRVVVEEPVLRLVCAEDVLPVERLVVVLLPVERLVRSVWVAVPVERLVVEPVLRLVCAEDVLPVERLVVVLLPVERFVRSV